MNRFAEVILPFPAGSTFTYRIPGEFQAVIEPGLRVVVPFGKKRFYSGIVHSVHNREIEAELKEIDAVPDDTPLVNAFQLAFWEWISDYYLCSIGEVMKAALPAGLKLESETRLMANDFYDFSLLKSQHQRQLFQLVLKNPSITLNELSGLEIPRVHSETLRMLDFGALIPMEKLKESYKPKTIVYISIHREWQQNEMLHQLLDDLSRAPKQQEVIQFFLDEGPEGLAEKEIKLSELGEKFGHQSVRALIKKDILIKKERQLSRIEKYNGEIREPHALNEQQNAAIASVRNEFDDKDVVLLHGVTSSGKTEIYIHLIEEVIRQGKQVLYLLPEIALTSQIVSRLQSVFGNQTGIYHSKFSDTERVEVFKNLAGDSPEKYKLILGVRSAVFLPFDKLGLVIVDEEHENTYKQYDPAPRYHARDASIVLASLHKAKVLLGTATPSTESYFNAKAGKYGLVSMTKRFGDVMMPEILVADLRKARLKREMKSVFTPFLLKNIKETIERNKQVILFQNRRGYSSFVECEVCGWIPRCKICDVSLTYHKYNQKLECHYCGATQYMPSKCGECNSTRMVTRGFGTELIEDEVSLLFPGVRIARLDLDTSRSRKKYEKILDDFGKGRIDILTGTQMLSKGLDFENVSLVGVLNADQLLNFPDFRAHERSFQLMAQVSGRAGRKDERGKVIIQTSDPSHPVIKMVQENDFTGLYQMQFEERQLFKYPPLVRMIRLVIRSKERVDAEKASEILAQEMRKIFGKRVLGPHAPLVGRIKNYYLFHIILKIEKKASFKRAKDLLKQIIEEAEEAKKIKNTRINIDVDPF